MSEEDSINTDNAEEHGLECVTTVEGEIYFLNPGNGIMYPRDKIEINPQYIERQRVIIDRLNTCLVDKDGNHLILEEMHDYRLKDFLNIIFYNVVEISFMVFVSEYAANAVGVPLYILILTTFLCSKFMDCLSHYIEIPMNQHFLSFLASFFEVM